MVSGGTDLSMYRIVSRRVQGIDGGGRCLCCCRNGLWILTSTPAGAWPITIQRQRWDGWWDGEKVDRFCDLFHLIGIWNLLWYQFRFTQFLYCIVLYCIVLFCGETDNTCTAEVRLWMKVHEGQK